MDENCPISIIGSQPPHESAASPPSPGYAPSSARLAAISTYWRSRTNSRRKCRTYNQATQHQSSSSVIGGVEAGYNLQFGYFVLGAETDIGFFRLHGSNLASAPFTGFPVPAGGTAPSYFNDVASDWLFTARGRLGFTPLVNLLVYGTGGFALTNLRHQAQYNEGIFPGTSAGIESSTSSGDVTGAVYGGGLAWAWSDNWLVKAEYLHVNFGSVTSAPSPVMVLGAPSGSVFTRSASLNVDIVRLGVDYKFW